MGYNGEVECVSRRREIVINKRLSLWVDSSAMGRAVERALKLVLGIAGLWAEREEWAAQNTVIFSMDMRVAESWFWEELRVPSGHVLNPVIIVGREMPAAFLDRNTAFVTWPLHQAYVMAGPRFLAETMDRIGALESIDDEEVIMDIGVAGRVGQASRLMFRLHSWKYAQEERISADLKMVKDFFESTSDDAGLILCESADRRLVAGGLSKNDGAVMGAQFSALLDVHIRRERGKWQG